MEKCNSKNNSEVLRIVRGNAFTMNITVEAVRLDGSVVEDFDLSESEAVLRVIHAGKKTEKEFYINDNNAIVTFDGTEGPGWYGMEMQGVFDGSPWRWCVENVFQLVETNEKANIPSWTFLVDDTYFVTGVLTLMTGGRTQADWDETNPSSSSYIRNKPIIYTQEEVNDLLSAEAQARQQADAALQSGKADMVANATNGDFAGLDANGNLTDSGKKASDFATAAQGALADTAYQKPSGGIPKTDLASDVQTSLGKADAAAPRETTYTKAEVDTLTANFITVSVNNLVNYYLKSDIYTQAEVNALIAAVQQFRYEVVAELPEASASTMSKIYLVPSSNPGTKNVKDEFITVDNGSGSDPRYTWEQIGSTEVDLSGYYTSEQTDAAISSALSAALTDYTTTADLTTLLAGKQNVISDLTTIRNGAAAGATAYQKPSGGIPKTDLASAVQTSLGKADTAYQKPSGGIPKTDLSTAVQTSLGKADTAIQDVNDKADKVNGATNGDLAGLDANGNLTDSGKKTSDFATAAQGALADSAYQKPSGGIPKTDLASAVQTSLGKADTAIQDVSGKADKVANANNGDFAGLDANGNLTDSGKKASDFATAAQGALADSAYQKPSGGIPKTDLASAVQTSLGKADTAIQDISGKADKVANATNGDLAGLDINGNLTDSGKKTSDFATAAQGALADTAYQKPSGGIPKTDLASAVQTSLGKADAAAPQSTTYTKTEVDGLVGAEETRAEAAEQANADAIAVINGKIPNAATPQNPLADKAWVNSSIATNTGDFVGTYNSLAELEADNPNPHNNDYGYVLSTDQYGNTTYDRYKYSYNSQGWVFEYSLNNSSFTADQWAAIQSGITSSLVEKLSDLPSNSDLNTLLADKADKVASATNGDFAGLDANGNLTDSGSKAADFATAAQGALADSAYQKPSGGIPKTDLASAVQTSLGKADTAIQDISGKADKVNGATNGDFAGLDANGNLTDSGKKTSDFATAAQGALADSAYQKPSGGIPKTDLASAVQTSLGKADTAIQDISGKADKVVNATNGDFAGLDANGNLKDSGKKASDFATAAQGALADSAYQLPSGGIPETDLDAATQQKINATVDITGKADKVSGATAGDFAGLDANGNLTDSGKKASDFATAAQGALADTAYQKPATGIPSTDMSAAVQTSLGKADTALQEHQSLANYYTKSEVDDELDGKQDVISDLATIRSGAAAGATAYQKPSNGIPETDLDAAVQTSLGKADTAYQKPSTGIPKTDMASAVQTSLGKADTALQSQVNADWNSNSGASMILNKPTTMGASGSGHKGGLVPDTPSIAGTTKFLREDGTWAAPSGEGGGNITVESNSAPTSSTTTYTKDGVTKNYVVGDKIIVPNAQSNSGYDVYVLLNITGNTATWGAIDADDGRVIVTVRVYDNDNTNLALTTATIAINGGTATAMTGVMDIAGHKKTFTATGLEVGDTFVITFGALQDYNTPRSITGTKGTEADLYSVTYRDSSAVDLGLTSGTLWAQGNIMKDGNGDYYMGDETDYGCLFSWGNIDGHPTDGGMTEVTRGENSVNYPIGTDGFVFKEENYWDWSTFLSLNEWTAQDANQYGFYEQNFGNGTPGMLLSGDIASNDTTHDAAADTLGGDWHMPSEEDFQELLDETDREWVTNYSNSGVNGYKFMKRSDHSVFIFMPAIPYTIGGEPFSEFGALWSRSFDDAWYAWSLFFDSSDVDVNISGRFNGYAVRAVQ